MPHPAAPTFSRLPRAGRLFVFAVFATAALALAMAQLLDPEPALDPVLFGVAAVLCAGASLFEVLAPAHYSFQPNLIFFFWAAILAPPWAVAALALVCFLPGAIARRVRWYTAAFNVGNYMLAGLAAHTIGRAAGSLGTFTSGDIAAVAALVIAAAVFVAVNHLLIVLVVRFAQGRPVAEAAHETTTGIGLDAALALMGAGLVVLWQASPAFVLLTIGPMFLVYRSLSVPLLRHKSETDPKTGLANSERLADVFAAELATANRQSSDLSVVMVDVDYLRAANNRWGHLAGDMLLRGVAGVLADHVGERGMAARFGGEEFCLMLPGTPLDEARMIAEAARMRTEALQLPIAGEEEPLRVTISAGIASYPENGTTVDELLQAADAAVYDAKLGGRNRVRSALGTVAQQALAADADHGPGARGNEHSIGIASAPSRKSPATQAVDVSDDVLTAATSAEIAASALVGDLTADSQDAKGSAPASRPDAPSRRLIPWYCGILCVGALLLAGITGVDSLADSPALFGLLAVSVLALDIVRIDIFERATISPATVSTLALAYLFGPVGPIATEGLIFFVRVLRRDVAGKLEGGKESGTFIRWLFDFGALGLAGGAAALAAHALPWSAGVGLIFACAVAGLTYYVVNTSLLSVVMGLAEGQPPLSAWREGLAWLWPHYIAFGVVSGAIVMTERTLGLYIFLVFGLPVLMLWVAQRQYVERSRSSVDELRRSHGELELANQQLRGLLADNQQLLGRMHRSYLSTITSLARTIEAKDPYTGGHTERVAQFARQLAVELEFDEASLRALDVGAVIHDIGKIGIPDSILLKPGKLEPEEIAEMRRHPEISSYIVAELELPSIVKQMVRSHHEWYDGSGYPDGLTGEEIPLSARILSVADALDAMTSHRPYRDALPLETAEAEIERMSGKQFCPQVTAALSACVKRDPSMWAGQADGVSESLADAAIAPGA
jgi:diguanylate cyclase (GGDEF)-like protein